MIIISDAQLIGMLLTVALAIFVGYTLFNWYMKPTKELLRKQTDMLRIIANLPPEEVKEERPSRGFAIFIAVLVILIVILVLGKIIAV
jgi:hypothetical protein